MKKFKIIQNKIKKKGSKNGEKMGKSEQARSRFKNMVEPIFQQKEVIYHTSYDSIMKIGEKHLFVCLRSSHKGVFFGMTRSTQGPRIKVSQIEWASKCLEELENKLNDDNKVEEGQENGNEEIIQQNKRRILGERYVITLVMHHNIWQDSSDKHSSVDGRNKLEKLLLRRFKFSVLGNFFFFFILFLFNSFFFQVCGHNHRLCFANTTTPKTHFRMYRCSLPTLSSRKREYESGYLKWDLNHFGTNVGPILIEFENEK